VIEADTQSMGNSKSTSFMVLHNPIPKSTASVSNAYGIPRYRCLEATIDFINRTILAMSEHVEQSRFLSAEQAKNIQSQFGTPVYVYDEKTLVEQATKALQFPNLYGINVRYAMKASPNAAILQLFSRLGLKFDASSGFEVRRAVIAGIPAQDISLSSQELPQDFKELIDMGIEFNACSLKQLETFGKLFNGGSCGVRFNPGQGSGGTGKTVSIRVGILSTLNYFVFDYRMSAVRRRRSAFGMS
jgi:hypothetical protein